jgi:hypothetical protein
MSHQLLQARWLGQSEEDAPDWVSMGDWQLNANPMQNFWELVEFQLLPHADGLRMVRDIPDRSRRPNDGWLYLSYHILVSHSFSSDSLRNKCLMYTKDGYA